MVVAAHLQDSVLVPDVVDLAVLERGIIAVHQIIEVSNEDMPVRSPSHRPMLPNAISGLPPIGFLYEESADWDPLKKSRRAPVSIL